jgi:hypothetical protein
VNPKTLIQIGCAIGDDYICKLIEDKQIDLAIFIDANIESLKQCQSTQAKYFSNKKHKPNLEYINCAISTIDTKQHPYVDFYIAVNDDKSLHASLDQNVVKGQSKKDGNFKTIQVQNINITDIFKSYKLKTIEYLITDIEGIDYFIARQLFKEGYLSPMVMPEDINTDELGRKIYKNLIDTKIDIKNYQFEFTHWGGYQQYECEKTRNELGYFLYVLINHGYAVYQSSATDILITKEPYSTYIKAI